MVNELRKSPALMGAVRTVAGEQGGVVSRRVLYGVGVTRWQIRGEVRAGRWQLIGDQSVATHNGPISETGHRWAAVFQGGPRACLDGVSALCAAGLERFQADRIRVSVPRGARVRRTPHWAATDRQATYLITLVVQQGLTTPARLGLEALRIRRDKRRLLVHAVVNELLDEARSLGELDVVAELRKRGLPPPLRQVLRRGPGNRYYLDLYWPEWRLVVEIDGIHHTWVENVIGDALRQNALAMAGDTVLRLPLLGLRLQPDDFFAQIEQALRQAGWERAA